MEGLHTRGRAAHSLIFFVSVIAIFTFQMVGHELKEYCSMTNYMKLYCPSIRGCWYECVCVHVDNVFPHHTPYTLV